MKKKVSGRNVHYFSCVVTLFKNNEIKLAKLSGTQKSLGCVGNNRNRTESISEC